MASSGDADLNDDEPRSASPPGASRRPDVVDLEFLRTVYQPQWLADFADQHREWRRFSAEFIGTFLLVVVAAGGGMLAAAGFGIGRTAAVVAPGLMVMVVILSIGTISGAHLNPVVTIAFALRGEFPWRRAPLYLLAQCAGGLCACLFLRGMFGNVGHIGATLPGHGVSDLHAMYMEILLTFGLLTTILGTASHSQNVGPLAALAVGGYIALAGLWASPITGTSMNPVRSFAPDVVGADYAHLWVYLAGPTIGMIVAVGAAWLLRGPGGQPESLIAQGTLDSLSAAQQVVANAASNEG